MKSTENFGCLVFMSMVAALGGFLFGYDTAVISGTIGQVTQLFALNPIQQGWYVGCALAGSIIGVLFAGILSDRFGRKKVMILSSVLFSASGIGCAVSGTFDQLVVYRIVGGMAIGVVSVISPLYISEVSISRHRGRLVSLYQLAITIGFLGTYLINYCLLKFSVNGAMDFSQPLLTKIFHTEPWRGMLGMESLPALFFFITIFFIPESPRWLLLKRQNNVAQRILQRIYRNDDAVNFEINQTMRSVEEYTRSEWKLIFEPAMLKAILIGVAIAILGQFMGVNAVLYYGPTIFESSGLSSGDSLFYQVLVGMVNMITTVLAMIIIDKVGRKKLVYFGVSGMILTLLSIAFYFLKGKDIGVSNVFLLVSFLLYIFCCAISICAVIWVLLSEMYPIKIRGMAMSVAGFSLWVGTYLIGQLTPWMLENITPQGTFVLFAIMCVPYILIIWKLVPETTGKSLEEIEKMWKKT